MYKALLLFFTSFWVMGCGGAGNNITDNLNDIDLKSLIEGKPYYEEDSCNDPKYTSYTIDKERLQIKSYNDADYSELVATKTYRVLQFENDDVQIEKDGDKLECAVSNDMTDTPAVLMYGLDCKDANNTESFNTLIYTAYNTKERAHANKYEGECP